MKAKFSLKIFITSLACFAFVCIGIEVQAQGLSTSGRKVSTESSAKSSSSEKTLLKFEWYYKFEPEPGRRYWYQTDKNSWVEEYPSGKKSYFNFVKNYTLDGISGILVQSTTDKSSVIFIPNKNEAKKSLRMKFSNEKSWRNIAEIRYIN